MNACVNLDLIEGQISSCKATQTDFDVPETAGKTQNSLPKMRFLTNSSLRVGSANRHDKNFAQFCFYELRAKI